MNQPDATLSTLRTEAQTAAERAFVPYSKRPEAAVALLSDGTWVPGVRVESASFSLVISPLVNAFSTAVASGRRDAVAVVLSRPALPEDAAFLHATLAGAFTPHTEDTYILDGVDALPKATERLVPFLDTPLPQRPAEGIELARLVAQRAHVPASDFPVGCVLATGDGRLIPGVNVEHADWSRILCAERNALGTAMTWGLTDLATLYLTCPKDPNGTPCGACRQLLVELAPASELWMDRGNAPAASSAPERLLPGAFRGNTLLHRP